MAIVKNAREASEGINQLAQEAVDRATRAKGAAHADLPAGSTADASGDILRGIVAEADKAKGAAVSKLYQAIDPEGNFRIVTSDPAAFAQKLKASINPDVEVPSPIAAPVIDRLGEDRELLAAQQHAALTWSRVHSWAVQAPQWLERLQRLG